MFLLGKDTHGTVLSPTPCGGFWFQAVLKPLELPKKLLTNELKDHGRLIKGSCGPGRNLESTGSNEVGTFLTDLQMDWVKGKDPNLRLM